MEVREALNELAAAKEREYLVEEADLEAASGYYSVLDEEADPAALFPALSSLLEETHRARPAYRPSVELYPWIDLQPNRKLRSVYTGEEYEPEELIQEAAEIEDRRASLRAEKSHERGATPESTEALVEELHPYNCEHVVCQSWFAHDEPMRGDLHHLFTCESRCNSFRGNFKYVDFPDFEKVVREDCGKREETGFEPWREKATVARATLYFLLRYPGLGIYSEESLAMLLKWHGSAPVSEYERHRNAAIFDKQGNRNPLIDHPEWAGRIAFSAGL